MTASQRGNANAASPSAERTARTGARPAKKGALQQLRVSDLRGAASLATKATTGISRVVEGVHQSVLGTLGLPGGAKPGEARGLTGLVYQSIRGVTRFVDAGLQAGLARLEPFFEATVPPTEVQWEREAVLAALNGVMGDRLQRDDNPLCTRMAFYQHGLPLNLPALARRGAATGKVLVLVHGLCMNDLQWLHEGHDHGAHLAQALGYTPVYLRYNTGLHTSTNGAELSAQLESLLAAWPVPVTDLSVLAHSMGGLVARSACHQAAAAGQGWLAHLRHLVCLGTPHHGAPLEKAGHWVDALLGSTAYSR
ncbi:MAG: alpha/beta hydrolase, partial [Comamonadaceae bacterium]